MPNVTHLIGAASIEIVAKTTRHYQPRSADYPGHDFKEDTQVLMLNRFELPADLGCALGSFLEEQGVELDWEEPGE